MDCPEFTRARHRPIAGRSICIGQGGVSGGRAGPAGAVVCVRRTTEYFHRTRDFQPEMSN